jgi:hypothetical protein
MRASTFTSVLKSVRDSRKPFPKEWREFDWEAYYAKPAAERGPAPSPPPPGTGINRADTALYNRWIDHPQAEQIWAEVRRYAPDLAATYLIDQVRKEGRFAVGAVNLVHGGAHLPGFYADSDALVSRLKEWLVRELLRVPESSVDLPELALRLEWAAADIRMLLGDFPDGVSFPSSDRSSNEDRARDIFQARMGEFFSKHTERKLKLWDVVAVLSEIAIPGKPVDPNSMVRRQRRRRKRGDTKRRYSPF